MSSIPDSAMRATQPPPWGMPLRTVLALGAAVLTPTIIYVLLIVLIYGVSLLYEVFTADAVSASTIGDSIAEFGHIPVAGLFLGTAALLIAGAHVAFLGVPAFLLGWRLGLIRWWTSLLVGFLRGCLPAALFLLPGSTGSWAQGIPPGLDSMLTSSIWGDYFQKTLFMGFFGGVGGYAFWLAWQFGDRRAAVRQTGPHA